MDFFLKWAQDFNQLDPVLFVCVCLVCATVDVSGSCVNRFSTHIKRCIHNRFAYRPTFYVQNEWQMPIKTHSFFSILFYLVTRGLYINA